MAHRGSVYFHGNIYPVSLTGSIRDREISPVKRPDFGLRKYIENLRFFGRPPLFTRNTRDDQAKTTTVAATPGRLPITSHFCLRTINRAEPGERRRAGNVVSSAKDTLMSAQQHTASRRLWEHRRPRRRRRGGGGARSNLGSLHPVARNRTNNAAYYYYYSLWWSRTTSSAVRKSRILGSPRPHWTRAAPSACG